MFKKTTSEFDVDRARRFAQRLFDRLREQLHRP